MKSGLKGGRADQELDEIAKSLLADESFLADDFEQMAHITTRINQLVPVFVERLRTKNLAHQRIRLLEQVAQQQWKSKIQNQRQTRP